MTINEYQELAMTTLNPELSKREILINSVMGLCGESGEVIDIVKNGWLRDMNWTRNFPNSWIDCAMIQKGEEAETFVKLASENQ